MFQQLFNAETLLMGLSMWGLGVTLYLLRMYVRRQSLYHTRVQDRLGKINHQPSGKGERPNL